MAFPRGLCLNLFSSLIHECKDQWYQKYNLIETEYILTNCFHKIKIVKVCIII